MECRQSGHLWQSMRVTEKPRYGVYRCFKCERCDAERWDNLESHPAGELLDREYRYPELHRIKRGLRR